MLKLIGGLTVYGFALYGLGMYLMRTHGPHARRD
jgi:hypothetical protein